MNAPAAPGPAGSAPPPEQTHLQLREWLGVLRLRKWSILAVTALVVGGAIFMSYRMTPIYESSAKVLVTPIRLDPTTLVTETLDLETEAGLATSTDVALMVIEKQGLDATPPALLGNLSVQPDEGTSFLVFSYEDPVATEARQMTAAFAKAYLSFREEQAFAEIDRRQEGIQARLTPLLEEQAEIQAELLGPPPLPVEDPQHGFLTSQLSQVTSQISTLQGQLSDPGTIDVGRIIDPPRVPSQPSRPNHIINGILAFIIGLALGIAVAFLRERLDDRLRGKDDLALRSGSPVLAVVPRVSGWKRRSETPVVTLAEPRSAAAEAYRTLRTNVLFAASQNGIRTVLVTSPHAGEGKTATSSNLAATLAQAGKRVIVVDADLRKPRLHKFFKTNPQPGLTDVLAGEIEPWEALFEPDGLPTLRILPSGRLPGNPAELLGSDAMGQLLLRLSDVADFVLIDTSPVLVASDPLILSAFVDAVLFAADSEKTTRGAVQQARQQLEQVNAQVIGAIYNNFDPSKAKASPYYYQYYYTYQQYAPAEAGNGRARSGGLRRASRRS